MASNKRTVTVTDLFERTSTWLNTRVDDPVYTPYLIHRGGTRSSKTFSILQSLVYYALRRPSATVDCFRKARVDAKRSILPDLKSILDRQFNVPFEHNKTKAEVRFPNGSKIRLRGTQDAQRLRGSKRDVAFLEEANEISEEAKDEIKLRTTEGKIVLAFNPSIDVSAHWIGAIPTRQATEIVSTYKDNPYLTQATINSIESLVPVYKLEDGTEVKDRKLEHTGSDLPLLRGNPVKWSIYGKGSYIQSPLQVFAGKYEFIAEPDWYEPEAAGIDFGYRSPTAVVTHQRKNGDLYLREELYQTELTTKDLCSRIEHLRDLKIYCDSAEPDRIQTMKGEQYRAYKAKKDVVAGLDHMLSYGRIYVVGDSPNLKKEISHYKFQSKGSDKPVKELDHACDASRYSCTPYVGSNEGPSMSEAFNLLN